MERVVLLLLLGTVNMTSQKIKYSYLFIYLPARLSPWPGVADRALVVLRNGGSSIGVVVKSKERPLASELDCYFMSVNTFIFIFTIKLFDRSVNFST